MKKQIHIYIGAFVLMLMSVVSYSDCSAQVINGEGFESITFPPTGWSAVGSISQWSRRTTGTFPTCLPYSGAAMARYNSRTSPAGTRQTLSTPIIDLTSIGTDTSRFSIWVFRNDTLNTDTDKIVIYINTSQSLTGATVFGEVARSREISMPDTEATNGWHQYTFDVPQGFNTNTNYILLEGVTGLGNNTFIDSVQWESFPLLCTGTPVSGIISAATQLICGGSGSSVLTLQSPDTTNGVTYQWQTASADSGPWTNFGTSVRTINSGTLTSTSYFRVLVTCSFSGFSDSTAVDSVVVSTAPLPNVIATPTAATYCYNTSVPAVLTASGAVSYTWSPATGLNATVGDTVYAIDTLNAVTYTVTGMDAFGCTDTAHVVVTPHNTPNVTGTASATNVCQGDSVTLNATSQLGSVTYIWYPGADTAASITVAPDTNTVYSVVGISLFGCSGTQSVDTASVSIISPAVASFTDSITARTVTFTNTSTGGTGYIWYFGDGNASFQSDPVYTYSADGTDTVMLVVLNGSCEPDTFIQVITIFTTDVSQLNSSNRITVLQNLTLDHATILFHSDQPKALLQVVNAIGQVVFERSIASRNNQEFKEEIDLSNLTSGVYSVHVISSGKGFSRKLIKL